nr:unnamed protein product [Digitaria exilis]
MPSHKQQSVPLCQDAARPPSCERPVRNWSRDLFSCSVHALDMDISSTSARLNEGNTSQLISRGALAAWFSSWMEN